GKPDKSNYRRFKIKDVKDIDDYAMTREIVRRRYERLKKEDSEFPDLIIIDGGKAHLQCVYEELLKLNLARIPIISIAKEEEKIYTVGSKTPVAISRDSEIMHFIQHMRDEAHRFALSYHHKLRKKSLIQINRL
ncbi:MAG: excinuclease ABC subunit C, partial [Candidatus Omnitrophota bacterium]